MKTEVLLGDEAVALGALHAGLGGAFAYPGTPATELNEYLFRMNKKFPDTYVEWSVNEKSAYEAALGMSYIGKRVIVSMKHVGLNVAADAFINSALTGVNGGLVVMVADDPGMHSSQNEQDTRFYMDFARLPGFEPSNQQEAYDMTLEAFELSERIKLPVVMRLVTRLAHSRANVNVIDEPTEMAKRAIEKNWKQWTLLPAIARGKYKALLEAQKDLIDYSEKSKFQTRKDSTNGSKTCIITSGIGHNYYMENGFDLPVLKISVYPLPEKMIRDFTKDMDEVFVFEDGYPFIETKLSMYLDRSSITIKGKLSGDLPETGELNPDHVNIALGGEVKTPALVTEDGTVCGRPPLFCDGCAHSEVYNIVDEIRDEYKDLTIFSDIGCYTLGALRTPPSLDTSVCMGASVGMAKGAANGGLKYAVGIIGDSTFMHSGIPTLVKSAGDNTAATYVILDNSTTGMTGQQDIPIPGERIEKFIEALGIPAEHIHILDPRKITREKNLATFKQELEYRGTSVIIARRECIQVVKRNRKH